MTETDDFRPYLPNAGTQLGKAYLYAVKDCDGPLLVTEANFLRDNPLLWLRALSLYASNLDHLIRQSNSRIKAMMPLPGETQTYDYMKAVKERRAWALVQQHRLNKIRARRAELVVEFGFQDIRYETILGDVVGAFDEILAAVQQHEWARVEQVSRMWLARLTELTPPADEHTPESVVQADLGGDMAALDMLLSRIRGEG